MTLDGFTPWPAETAARYRELGYWTGERLDRVAVRHAQETPDAIALVDGTERIDHAELERRIARRAAGLRARGVLPRDRVLLQLPNRISFVVTALAIMRAGAIPVYLLPAHRESEVSAIAAQTEPVAFVVDAVAGGFDHRALAETVRADAPSLRLVVVDGEPLEGQLALDALDAGARAGGPDDTIPLGEDDAGDVAFLQLSGGTTGTPKLIPRSHDDYLYSVRRSVEVCDFDRGTVLLVVLPAAHNFPMSSPGFLGALLAGGRVVLGSSPAPDHAFPLIERERVTVVSLVPPLALAWTSAARTTRHDLSSLATVQVGGAKLVPEAARAIEPALGARLQQVFGMAEGLVCYTDGDDNPEFVATSQGRPMSDADEILVVDDDDRPVPDGEPGHLLVRGPYTIRGYYRAAAHNARSFTESGHYRTGDIVRRLAGGHLSVEGRSKDQINRGGEKISAEEIEDHLLAHPLVHDAAVVAIPDPYLGERSCAVIVPVGERPTRAELLAFVRSRGIASHKVPDRIEIVDVFPTTGVGKTSRAQLRRELSARFASPAAPAGSRASAHTTARPTPTPSLTGGKP